KPRSFEEYGVIAAAPKKVTHADDAEQPLIPLPPEISELWLPLVVALVCYGLSLYISIKHVLESPGLLAGMLILAFLLIVFVSAVIPFVIRTVEGASKTFDFTLPNSVWLQAFAACGPPVAGIVVGLFAGGVAGMFAGLGIGLTFMLLLMLM